MFKAVQKSFLECWAYHWRIERRHKTPGIFEWDQRIVALIEQTCDLKQGMKVLDLGCGGGDQIKVFAERGHFDGIGKPEPRKGELSGFWSRRIEDIHRFVYRIGGGVLEILSCRGHDDDSNMIYRNGTTVPVSCQDHFFHFGSADTGSGQSAQHPLSPYNPHTQK